MKKFFTLIAGMLLLSGSAFGQARWTSVIKNGDLEGAQDPKWSSFWCHDYRKGVEFDPESGQEYQDGDSENGQFRGFAEIVEDPANPANHCAKVIIRSEAEADEAGNKVSPDGSSSLASWDCQFFIYANEPIPEGKEVRMILKVKGEKAGKFETQAHWKPGDYNHYVMFGDQNFGTEWTLIETDAVTVSADQSKEADGKFFQSVAFNLSTTTEGNVIYFDDIDLQVRDAKDPAEFEGWFNFLRNGTSSNDVQRLNTNYTTFTGRDGIDGVDRPARIVNDPIDGQPALNVTTVAWEGSYDKEILDEEGNPKLDDEGNPTFETIQYFNRIYKDQQGNDSIAQKTSIDDWETQFFVSIPHILNKGEKIKFHFWYRADKPTSLDTQIHKNPGAYVHWSFVGSLDVTEEWQEYDNEITLPSEANSQSCWTMAFNCNKGKDEVNNIYFRFDEFSVNSAEVKEEDCVLASEDIIWQLPEMGSDDPVVGKIDLTKAMETLGVDSPSGLMDGVILASLKNDEGNTIWEEIQPDYFVDASGNSAEDGINIAYDDELTEGNVVGFNVYNDKTEVTGTVPAKLIFKKYEDSAESGYARRGWSYLYNISLMNKDAYEQAMGVAVMKAVKADGAIYDLSGRRVLKATKGLYIKDGKKIVIK